MSWMDSWSRPGKSSAIPPPYYLTTGDSILYCHTCGRMISPRKSHSRQTTPVKYCSERCRTHKPGPPDKRLDEVILALLEGRQVDPTSFSSSSAAEQQQQQPPPPAAQARGKTRKGDPRRLISCDEIEQAMFGDRHDPEKVYGRNKNRYSRAIRVPDEQWRSVDMESSSSDDDSDSCGGGAPLTAAQRATAAANAAMHAAGTGGARIRPPQTEAEMNFSAMGGERSKAEKIDETPENLERRQKGQQEAEEREMVRRAARRAVVFGLLVPEEQGERGSKQVGGRARKDSKGKEDESAQPGRRKCEAVMNGQVVEPSYAKGNWAIRWRE